MKLAEALTARADLQRRIEQLRDRITANARYQEGEEPAEDAAALLVEAEAALGQLRDLIRRINATNARLDLGDGTMTDALARRDVLRLQHSLLADAAAAASGAHQVGLRQMRSELRQIAALPVAPLRSAADDIAQELRELDNRIQQANWTHDLEG
ncbi:DIP1984 family protein [Microbacterium sp. CIAB417]|uniref:DIP1984 family protein n=1 Tax=Microbacterium sp. CIAB417 TaxID=2860287 RepID=UPI001FACF67B|nr:DIP1984 family protein [Microbacterium sp. CIAB417]